MYTIISMYVDIQLFSNGRGLLTSKEQIPPASYGPAASAFQEFHWAARTLGSRTFSWVPVSEPEFV